MVITSRRAWSRVVVGGFLLLLLNSAYLASFSEPPLWYYTQVALHPLVGIALAAVVTMALVRRRLAPGRLRGAGLVLCGLGLALGLLLVVTGATTAYRSVVVAHIALSAAGAPVVWTRPGREETHWRSSTVEIPLDLCQVEAGCEASC